MHERFQKTKTRLRGGAALCLSVLLLFPFLAGTASAQSVTSSPVSASELVPVGHTIGIKLFSRGVLVVGLAKGSTPAEKSGLEKGDLILKCSGVSVTSSEQFRDLLQQSSGKAVPLQVCRGTSQKTIRVTPGKNDDGEYTIGAWIRDSMAGIGTMTFYDPDTGVFGALGHGITDPDTTQLMSFASGSILPSAVKAVKKGASGEAGELRGDFDLNAELGDLYANTSGGVFGTLNPGEFVESLGKAMPVAENSEVKSGKAQILSNVRGDQVETFDVKITRVTDANPDGRDLLITITDPDLLKETGGIVQGMSGSPILQNGKIVGAVTHVLLNDPTRGYGILIRNMLESESPAFAENVS